MPFYRAVGDLPTKRHIQHRSPLGDLYFEELLGTEGFSAISTLLYHRKIPASITEARDWEVPDQSLRPNSPLLPRRFDTHSLFADGGGQHDSVTGRRLILGNEDVRLSYVLATTASPLYRNAIGDELLYVEDGQGRLESMLGPLQLRSGDYVVVPRSMTHRVVPEGDGLRLYVIEASSHIRPPHRFLSKDGQFLEHSPYCERDLVGPSELPEPEEGEVEVFIKHRGQEGPTGSVHVVPNHPFDVIGWDGCNYPYTFNIENYEPITGRVHQPPPVHQVFEADGFVVCNFVPRKVDYHPLAVPAPYYHSNVDSDEVMFYCGGNYEARKGAGITQGSISLHPGGHIHGPQPGAYEGSIGVEFFDELAVMVDTFSPLRMGEAAGSSEAPDYAQSWSQGTVT